MRLAVDTETTGLDLWKDDAPYAVSSCDDRGNTTLFRWKVNPANRTVSPDKGSIKKIQTALNKADEIIFHNAKFDIRAIELLGIQYRWWDKTHDTLILSHLFNSAESHDLKELASKYLRIDTRDEKAAREATIAARRQASKLNWSLSTSVKADFWIPGQIDSDDSTLDQYAVWDAVRLINLYLMYCEELAKPENHELYQLYERERAIQAHVYRMETHGVMLRKKRLFDSSAALREEIEKSGKKLQVHIEKHYDFFDLNPRSGKQLADLLFQRMRLPAVKTTKKGNPSLDREVLDHYYDNLPVNEPEWKTIDLLLDLRFSEKSLDYLQQYRTMAESVDGKLVLHPSFNQCGTRTTRFSSSNPNTQNIGKGDVKEGRESLRKVFGPRPGYFWLDIDYSQIELRLFAWAAEEAALIEAFMEGQDIHSYVAETLGVDRRSAKGINFGLIYGAQQPKIDSIGGPGTYDRFIKQFPSLPRFQARCAENIRDKGFVETLFGYRLTVDQDSKGKWLRQGPNYVIQGSAGDMFKYGFLNVCELLQTNYWKRYDIRPVLMVHDELVIEVPNSLSKNIKLRQDLVDALEEPSKRIGCYCPVEVNKVRVSWDQSKPVEESSICSSYRTALQKWWKYSASAKITRLRSKNSALCSASS